MNELKPCPFCGGKAEIFSGGFGERFVACSDVKQCGGRLGTGVWFTNDEDAIKIWNTRTIGKKVERK